MYCSNTNIKSKLLSFRNVSQVSPVSNTKHTLPLASKPNIYTGTDI